MADLVIPRGNKGFYLNFTVQNSDGTAFDLTGYTVKLKVWSAGVPATLLVNTACEVVNAAAGTCRYSVAASDFATTGQYSMELELTQEGVIESTREYTIAVVESG